MEKETLIEHWEAVYKKQEDHQKASWYQEEPGVVFEWLKALPERSGLSVIDIGAGDSYFVDQALKEGFYDITALDLSAHALEKAKKRLGKRASEVRWICSDVTQFSPSRTYQVWHDRATFHFLHSEEALKAYKKVLQTALKPRGYLVLATFSEDGPDRCSGLPVRQYDVKTLQSYLGANFELIEHTFYDHQTPGGKIQNFIYTLFRRVTAPETL
ncbi:class I SAM-dependent methyltransferase [Robertkochia marina]|nr:class I SAM-dependent methyltransferase [Robertkochia marina]TRZ41516.1 class I SAM-dependent methyltransferase [Robertkochia marina]